MTAASHDSLLADRLDRSAMTWLLLAVLAATPVESLANDHRLAVATLPMRAAVLVGLLVALRVGGVAPVVVGRVFLGWGLTEMVGWTIALDSRPDRVVLEAAAYGTILSIVALLIAPRRTRRWWSLAVVGVVLVPAAVRLLPEQPALLAQAVGILVVHSAALAVLDVHANRAERAGALDPLTGLLNRRPTIEGMERAIVAAADGDRASLLLVDLDGFKRYNDTHGHEAGDEALRRVAAALSSAVRPSDAVGRWGGEEFVVLLPGTSRSAAAATAERLRAAIAAGGATTASIGVAEVRADDSVRSWVRRADVEMYVAKGDGGDRVSARSPAEVDARAAADADVRGAGDGSVAAPPPALDSPA